MNRNNIFHSNKNFEKKQNIFVSLQRQKIYLYNITNTISIPNRKNAYEKNNYYLNINVINAIFFYGTNLFLV